MSRHAVRSLALLAFAVLPLAAQHPNTRSGFWISGGIGSGSVGADCSDCSDDRSNGISTRLGLGGTLSPHVLLGFEASQYGKSEDGIDQTMVFGSVAATIYPWSAGAFFLKAGIGGMNYKLSNGSDELTAKAPALLLGAGYDFRVGTNLSITPYFNALGTSEVSFRFNDIAVPTGEKIKANLVQFGVALTIH